MCRTEAHRWWMRRPPWKVTYSLMSLLSSKWVPTREGQLYSKIGLWNYQEPPKVPLGNEKLKIETRDCDFTIQDITTFKCQQIHQHLQNMGKDNIIFDCFQSLVSCRLAVTLLTSVNTSQDKSIFLKVNFCIYLQYGSLFLPVKNKSHSKINHILR